MAQMKTLTINGKKYVIVGAEGIPEDMTSGLTASFSEDGTKLTLSWQEGTGNGAASQRVVVSLASDTDISGLRQATAISMVKADSVITVTTNLEGGAVSTSEITLGTDGYPRKIVTDGVECALNWSGFD